MEGISGLGCTATSATPTRRTCSRRGCANPVKKATAKYCSVDCCAIDPERHERLRMQARRTGRRNVLPLARQLRFDLTTAVREEVSGDPEAQLALIGAGREDVPRGMSRLSAG